MNEVIVTPSPATQLRRLIVRLWDEPDARSTAVGIAGVILIYLLIFLVAPKFEQLARESELLRPRPTARQFSIELTPESLALVRPPPQPKQFVETNPDAPENIPDHTNNFAAQNQQVAQPKPTPDGHSERPAMEGRKDFQSTQIVSGRLEKVVPHISPSPVPQTMPHTPSAARPRAEQNPLPGFEKIQGDNPDSYGTNVADQSENVRPIPEHISGQKNIPLVEGALGLEPAIDPKHPRPRISLVQEQQVRPAILAEQKAGTSNVGVVAINAKFNQYGLYLQRLVEAVQLAWDAYLERSQISPPSGTYVVVHWVLNSKGEVVRFSNVENHSTDVGAQACTAAITARAPFGEWSDDMKAALNPDGEELVFTFYYQ